MMDRIAPDDLPSEAIPNVLASRYASAAIRSVWSPVGRVIIERELWTAVLEAQAELEIPTPASAVRDYRAVVRKVDLDSIRARERITRHDVKARIDEFCSLAGHEVIHRGLTSRDVTENVEQMLIRQSLQILADKTVAVLGRMAARALEHRDTVIVSRTHNVPAQPTALGKRFADAAAETLLAFRRLEYLIDKCPLRGLKGAVGNQQDLLDLFDGDADKVEYLERSVAERLGFRETLSAVGQVYPRSLDLEVVAALVQLSAGPSSLATTLRLMAGHDLVTEGFARGQVGSSAMPHKRNMRTCERIGGFSVLLNGYLGMAGALAGGRWNEGDVSDSVVRRVMIPDSIFACDGLLEAMLHVLDGFTAFPGTIQAELEAELPFFSSTRLLTAGVQAGMGREEAHEVIRHHTLAAADARHRGNGYDLWEALGADRSFPLDGHEIRQVVMSGVPTGRAADQIDQVAAEVSEVVAEHPDTAAYQPETLL
ncbi:adenylosuccinate lyase [Candidatus Poriferisocius sp.]|uniref:adenylosuccinate lyase n=1 Tax=Candidatus Poriferisocius sp. TaxID=3101276 RepID=UPI003B517841